MRLNDKDLVVVHTALGLYKASVEATLEKGGLTSPEETLLEDISVDVEEVLKKVGRRIAQ